MALIDIHSEGQVTHMILNRPRQLNALSPALLESLIEHCDTIGCSNTKIVVLSGAGDAFSAGADLTAFAEKLMGSQALEFADLGRRAANALAAIPQLKIAWIDGVCIGGGLVLASACDLRWTTPDSSFSLPELAIGFPVGWGGTARIAEIIGLCHTKALTIEPGAISAQRAHAIGLVSQVFEHHDAYINALNTIAEIPRFSLEKTLSQFQGINDGTFVPQADAQLLVDCFKIPEVLEKLMTAWQNKSPK